jgi:zona occludens toxin
MLYIRTGKPGHGKTLNTIKEVDEKSLKESRPVYYHNINGLNPALLKASWYKFDDPEKWFELPDNSIVVVDESQRWFASRDPRARPSEHITRFETMRHNGFEVHLITQDPRYLDVHLRRLCNGHIHYWRVFKSQQLIRFESEAVIEKVEVKSSFKDADKRTVKLDKKFFDVYTSSKADHHFKAKLPTKFILAMLVIAIAAFAVYRAFERYSDGKETDYQEQTASGPIAIADNARAAVSSMIGASPGSSSPDVSSLEDYLAARTPRIPDVPSSAPIYDDLTKPQTYPKLSCVISSDESYIERNRSRYRVIKASQKSYICECFTQQATWYKTTFSYCKNAVNHGSFDPAKPDREKPTDREPRHEERDQFGPDTQSAELSPPTESGMRVTRIESGKPGILW